MPLKILLDINNECPEAGGEVGGMGEGEKWKRGQKKKKKYSVNYHLPFFSICEHQAFWLGSAASFELLIIMSVCSSYNCYNWQSISQL